MPLLPSSEALSQLNKPQAVRPGDSRDRRRDGTELVAQLVDGRVEHDVRMAIVADGVRFLGDHPDESDHPTDQAAAIREPPIRGELAQPIAEGHQLPTHLEPCGRRWARERMTAVVLL